ncbi:MAG TPA: TetR/AcrR family transcriptional regulator [Acidimicrobiales bacterium]
MSSDPIKVPEIVPGSEVWWRLRTERDARRRPRVDGLTIERITAAALRIIDEEGLDALTMRRLADELGAGAASLYRHVANRDELVVEIIDHVLGEVGPPPETATWREGAEHMARDLQRVLSRHPGVIRLVPGDPLVGPNALLRREQTLRYLLDHGFGEAEAVQVYAMVVSWILGYMVLTRGRHTQRRAEAFRAVSPDDYPTISDLADIGPPGEDELFELGLVTLLDGIEARYPEVRGK